MPFLKTVTGPQAEVDQQDYHRLYYHRYHVVKSSGIVQRGIYSTKLNKTIGRVGLAQDVLNISSSSVVMFLDGNKLNCKRKNLKVVPLGKRNISAKLSKVNKTGYRGVSFNNKIKRYEACIRHNYKKIHIGNFKNIIEAAMAYDKKAIELFGTEFTRLNIPPIQNTHNGT